MHLRAPFVYELKLGAAANAFVRSEIQKMAFSVGSRVQLRAESYSLETVRRFRPFARRRFSTNRPFFVLMRTRNPCAFLRWRVLG
jgi:hypothetical protein